MEKKTKTDRDSRRTLGCGTFKNKKTMKLINKFIKLLIKHGYANDETYKGDDRRDIYYLLDFSEESFFEFYNLFENDIKSHLEIDEVPIDGIMKVVKRYRKLTNLRLKIIARLYPNFYLKK